MLELGLGVARLGGAGGLVEPLLHAGQIGQSQLDVDDLPVSNRIHRAHDVLDVGVLEAANHVDDRIHLTDVGQELVSQTLAFTGTLDQPGDVHELDHRRHGSLGIHDLGQGIEPRIGHLHDPGVGLDGGKGIVRHQRLGRCEGVKECGFAHVGQSHNSESKHKESGVRSQESRAIQNAPGCNEIAPIQTIPTVTSVHGQLP